MVDDITRAQAEAELEAATIENAIAQSQLQAALQAYQDSQVLGVFELNFEH